jgi:DNA-directed RNA polymerase subunit RPC12/RpoP
VPKYHYECSRCGTELVRILSPAESLCQQFCRRCGELVTRKARGITSTKFERLDNGFMAKPVERPADAERLYKERAKIDPTKE